MKSIGTKAIKIGVMMVAAVLLLVIYGGYFLATCWGSRRIVRGG